MTRSDDSRARRPPRERFAGPEHVFDLRSIAAGLRDEREPVRGGHRQMTIYHKSRLTLVLFDFETGARLTDHVADAQVAILTLAGLLEVATSERTYQLPEGSVLVLDPGVHHDVFAHKESQMLLTVTRVAEQVPDR